MTIYWALKISQKNWDQFAGHNEIKLQLNNKKITENPLKVGNVNPHFFITHVPNKNENKILWMKWNMKIRNI